MREYPPHLTLEAIENDFLRGWDYTPRFCFRLPDHAKPTFFWQVPMADVVVVQLVLISRDNLSHSGPFCLVDDTFLDDEPITERSFRAVWFHSTSLSETIIRWVLDAPMLLRGMYCFILINGRALSHSLGSDTPTPCTLRNGDVISFSLHDDDGVVIDAIRHNIPALSRVPPAGVPAHFYDGRFVAERRRRQNRLDAALGSGALSLEGGGWGIREARSHGLASTLPLRVRAYFYDEFGHLGTREYGPAIQESERHADYLQHWDVPQLIFEICDYVPSGIVEASHRDSVRAECVLLSHRVLPGQTLCLFDGSMLAMRRSRRPFHPSQGLHSFWTHTTQVSDPCIRWILDIPRFLDGFYIFVRINSFTLPLHSRQFVPSGACFWLSSRSHYDRLIRDNQLAPQLDISSSADETFRSGFDDNTHGIHGGFFFVGLSIGHLVCCFGYCPLSGGGELSQSDMGKLSQQIKALELGFAAPQIRVVLMTDSKATAKMFKASNQDALKSIFSAAAKRIGLSPKAAAAAPSFEPSASVAAPDKDDGWTTVVKKTKAARASSAPPAPRPNHTVRTFSICPEGWSVPVMEPDEVRPDAPCIFALDDEAKAHSLWARCKSSSKAIALLAPRDLKVGTRDPVSYLVPFFEKAPGLPTRRVDLQVWLHQLSTAEVSFASPRKVVDMGLSQKRTSVFRARIDKERISSNYRTDFAKGNKAIMRAALTPVLGDSLSKVIDLWSPKLDPKGEQVVFFIRSLSQDAEELLKLSRPDRLVIYTPLEDTAKFKHVWLKSEGAPMSLSDVEKIMSSVDHFGAFNKQGTWALTVKDDQFSAVKQSLRQNALPAYLILGLPADYVSEQVEEFCEKLGWSVQVDPLSRRFRNRRLQWIVRASSAPPINSTYCSTGYARLRIDIESAVRQRSPSPPPRVDIDDFQTLTFAQQTARPRPKIGPGRSAVGVSAPPASYAQAHLRPSD